MLKGKGLLIFSLNNGPRSSRATVLGDLSCPLAGAYPFVFSSCSRLTNQMQVHIKSLETPVTGHRFQPGCPTHLRLSNEWEHAASCAVAEGTWVLLITPAEG